jgi:type IV pilus assembly protein PilY1
LTSGTATTPKVLLSALVQQTINTEGTITVADKSDPLNLRTLTYDYRTTSANPVNFTNTGTNPNRKGWYMELLKPDPDVAHQTYQGERVVSMPLLRGGRVVFTTLVPSSDSCAFGGDSWVMEVDLATGGATSSPSFDINKDRSFSTEDKTTTGAVISGIKSSEGIIKTPAVISAGGIEYKYASGTSGNIQQIVEKGTAAVKRTSWRQLQ